MAATDDVRSDLPQGTLDLLIFKVVGLGPLHGYAIAQRLEQISRGVVDVQQGTLYPALHRLENRGLLDAEWKVSDTGRQAKFYRLTRRGRAQLEAETASWKRLADAVGLILRATPDEARSAGGREFAIRRRLERELSAELADHIERHVADLVAAGVAEPEARRRARLALGGVEQMKEACRDERGTRWLLVAASELSRGSQAPPVQA